VESTFLLHKPVSYGSSFANFLFLMMLLLHIIAGAIAPLSAIAAFTARKGSKLHMRSGRFFAESMVIVALTGIMLDIVRLCFFVKENHTKYAGYTMPSTYPARLGFLFVGLCILYILREVTPPQVFNRQSEKTAITVVPSLIVATGLALTAIIVLQLNPWTGALWMIWTFILIVIVIAQTAASSRHDHERNVARHRFGMSCLAAFSWWGAFQGFGPAIAISINGNDPSTSAYLGNQPGSFSPAFLLFLAGWAPFFFLAAYLIRRFAKLSHP
jgi:NADH:ubiquinone oxidoreductase subunit 6 (subunit J)